MPLYPYKCNTCEEETEELESLTAPETKPCKVDDCSGMRKRTIGVGSFHLKGGGWASDGYSTATSKE